jgi:hypothetical protein
MIIFGTLGAHVRAVWEREAGSRPAPTERWNDRPIRPAVKAS